jgi:hypothetical protein
MMIGSRLYGTFTVVFGTYGFTRGYRSVSYCPEEQLITKRVLNGVVTSMFYVAPVVNIWALARLVDRIEISIKNYDKSKYDDAFEEFTGVCIETI